MWNESFPLLLNVLPALKTRGGLYSCRSPMLCTMVPVRGLQYKQPTISRRFPFWHPLRVSVRGGYFLHRGSILTCLSLSLSLSGSSAGATGPISKFTDSLQKDILIPSRVVGVLPWFHVGISRLWGPHFLGLLVSFYLKFQKVIDEPVNVHPTAKHELWSGRWALVEGF